MNKLLGFFELRDSGLPAVPWQKFDKTARLDQNLLWTFRTAVEKGTDINLPRLVGVTVEEGYSKALELYESFKDRGMVIYYPYFIAEKSGVLDVGRDIIVVEAVEKDLWNLVTHNRKNVTIVEDKEGIRYHGDRNFLDDRELGELKKYAEKVKSLFRGQMAEGNHLILEWSFAYNTDVNRQPIGEKYLVFYEIRAIR